MARAVLRAKIEFFDTNPLGRHYRVDAFGLVVFL